MSAPQKEKDVPIRIKPSVKKMLDDAKFVPRESYSDCIKRVLIGYQKYQKKQLVTDMKRISETGEFIAWDEAKKELNL
jgi:hypothetical protein